MRSSGNILIFTQWSFKDALVQTYTLPYVDIIRKIIPPGIKILVVTSEQQQVALSDVETAQVNREWEKRNMQLLPEPYKRFGLKKMFAAGKNLLRLRAIIKKRKNKNDPRFLYPGRKYSLPVK